MISRQVKTARYLDFLVSPGYYLSLTELTESRHGGTASGAPKLGRDSFRDNAVYPYHTGSQDINLHDVFQPALKIHGAPSFY